MKNICKFDEHFETLTRNSRYEICLMEKYNKQPGKSETSCEHPKNNRRLRNARRASESG